MRFGGHTRVLAVLCLSLGVHAGIFAGFGVDEEDTQVAGGAPMQLAALGNSFEDLVAAGGRLQPVDGEDEVERITAPSVQPLQTQAVEPVIRDETVKPVGTEAAEQPVETRSLAPVETETAEKVPATEALTNPAREPAVQQARAVPGLQAVEQEKLRTAALPEAARVLELETAREAAPAEKALPLPAEAVPVPEPAPRAKGAKPLASEAVRPEPARKPAPATVRPRPEKAEKDKRRTRPKKRVTQGRGKGKADRDAIRGSADGAVTAKSGAANTRPARTASLAGNAAASNYPGQVQAKIHRTRKRRAAGRGKVLVRFSVTRDGGLGSVKVARGSGVSAIDALALDHIRRAAPFPSPPAGAQTRFTMWVQVGR